MKLSQTEYSHNPYTDDYYFAQYVFSTAICKRKICYLLLTEREHKMLEDRMPNLVFNMKYPIENSEYVCYEVYRRN